VRYAQESAWREDHRRLDNGRQTQAVMGLAMACRRDVGKHELRDGSDVMVHPNLHATSISS